MRRSLPLMLMSMTVLAALAARVLAGDAFTDEAGKHVDIAGRNGGLGVRYMYERDTATPASTFDTGKVFLHVLTPDGKSTLTKGAGGLFPHHRGIYIGWNKITHDGKQHDIWHLKGTEQVHRSFVKREATDAASTLVARIDWVGTHKQTMIEETRTVTVRHDDKDAGGAKLLLDVSSELKASNGDVKLDGDPEHAGVQFRPSQEVAANKSATYVFPTEKAPDLKTTMDLPWVAETFKMADGSVWTVQQMSHPDNAPGKWSAYRDYGRFGEFPVIEIKDGQTVTLRTRFRITAGEAPTREAMAAEYAKYAKSDPKEPAPVTPSR